METYVLYFSKKGKNTEFGTWEDNGQKETLDAGRSYRCGAGTMHCSSDYF